MIKHMKHQHDQLTINNYHNSYDEQSSNPWLTPLTTPLTTPLSTPLTPMNFSQRKSLPMNASIVGRYGFRRKSEQRSAALERAWVEAPGGTRGWTVDGWCEPQRLRGGHHVVTRWLRAGHHVGPTTVKVMRFINHGGGWLWMIVNSGVVADIY